MVGLRVTDQDGLIGHADIHGDLPVGAADGRKIGRIAGMSTFGVEVTSLRAGVTIRAGGTNEAMGRGLPPELN
jgi:hypothetical protein